MLKVAYRDLPHKTEFEGVILNLNDKSSIEAVYRILINPAKSYNPNAVIDGILVVEMILGGVETVLGVFQYPVFGPTVMFGLGGVFVEVLKDVAFRVAPFGLDEARRMINEICGRELLNGVRGAKASDTEALAKSLSNLSVFVANNSDFIHSIEINPFIVMSEGGVAADALIISREKSSGKN